MLGYLHTTLHNPAVRRLAKDGVKAALKRRGRHTTYRGKLVNRQMTRYTLYYRPIHTLNIGVDIYLLRKLGANQRPSVNMQCYMLKDAYAVCLFEDHIDTWREGVELARGHMVEALAALVYEIAASNVANHHVANRYVRRGVVIKAFVVNLNLVFCGRCSHTITDLSVKKPLPIHSSGIVNILIDNLLIIY